MILQTLDILGRCLGYYHDKGLVLGSKSPPADVFTSAWKYSPILEEEGYTFLYLLTSGRKLSTFSSDLQAFENSEKKIKAQQKAATTARMNVEDVCLMDLIPEHQYIKYLSCRQEALYNVAQMCPPGSDYEILKKIHILTEKIKRQPLFYRGKTKRVLYDIFGSATGRLTTEKGSVPILTLKKKEREEITPQNDAFVELDFNAAEVRMLFALSGQEQPSGDIHEWVAENIYNKQISREKAKTKLFSWLYNFSASENALSNFFSREIFRDFYLAEKSELLTPFGRILKVEERKAQNYLLQSTTSDQVLENAYKIQTFLEDKKSTVAFTLHDSIIVDLSKEDASLLRDIKKLFDSTRWGSFRSTCKVGKNFGNLKELEI